MKGLYKNQNVYVAHKQVKAAIYHDLNMLLYLDYATLHNPYLLKDRKLVGNDRFMRMRIRAPRGGNETIPTHNLLKFMLVLASGR